MKQQMKIIVIVKDFFYVVLGLELRAYTLSHSTTTLFKMGFL
jgi:hypothetical protein